MVLPPRRIAADPPSFNLATSTRQAPIIDLDGMASTALTVIGVGRALGFVEFVAGAGIGAADLFDDQTVSAENVGMAAFTSNDINSDKVVAAAEHMHLINPSMDVRFYNRRATPDDRILRESISGSDLTVIGIDEPRDMFRLAQLTQGIGRDALVIGSTDDNQYFVAYVDPDGASLPELLPRAFASLGKVPQPAFYPSTRLYAERLNVVAFELALGLLHHPWSDKPVAEIGRKLREETPLLVGLNGTFQNEYSPARFLTLDEIRAL